MLQDLDMDNDNEVAEQHELTPDGEIGFIGSSALLLFPRQCPGIVNLMGW